MSVHYDVRDHVATVTIDRPDVLNAIDLDTEAELQRIWTDLEQRRDARVVVLVSASAFWQALRASSASLAGSAIPTPLAAPLTGAKAAWPECSKCAAPQRSVSHAGALPRDCGRTPLPSRAPRLHD
jgi:hypothetical protein